MNSKEQKVNWAAKADGIIEVRKSIEHCASRMEEMGSWCEGNVGPWHATSKLAFALSTVLSAAHTISLQLNEAILEEMDEED